MPYYFGDLKRDPNSENYPIKDLHPGAERGHGGFRANVSVQNEHSENVPVHFFYSPVPLTLKIRVPPPKAPKP